MATYYYSDSEDDFHSLSLHEEEEEEEDDDEEDGEPGEDTEAASTINSAPPLHPVPTLQGAFEESIYECTAGEDGSTPHNARDAEMRRRKLSEARRCDDVRKATRNKQNTAARYHPLLKLMAQIVFGLHLLQRAQAKSNEEVVRILQNHVNEVDSFLERTSDDLDRATTDIEERIRYLKLPMQHMDVFKAMLDEKQFRTDLVNGNEKIEKIINRTAKAMNNAVSDIKSGIDSTKELGAYLTNVETQPPLTNVEIADVFAAMRGNEKGWMRFLRELRIKGENLGNNLAVLGNIIETINKQAAAASRRNKPQSRTITQAHTPRTGEVSSALRSKYYKDTVVCPKPGPWLNKPLPKEPNRETNALKVAMPTPHPVPFATRYEQPRQHAPEPKFRSSSIAERRSASRLKLKTAGHDDEGPKGGGAQKRNSTSELANFLRTAGPLRSNPPDHPVTAESPKLSARQPRRSQSQTAAQILSTTTPKPSTCRRSQSQGDLALSRELSTQAPTATIPRKSVNDAQQKKSRTQIKYVPPVGLALAVNSPSISSGFSRRLSKKLRTLPPRLQNSPQNEPVAKPVDSAYSSDRKRSTSSPTNHTLDTEKDSPDIEKTLLPDSEKYKFAGAKDTGPGLRFGLFPKDTGPLTPSQASLRDKYDSPDSRGLSALPVPEPDPTSKSVHAAPQMTHTAKSSRTLSLRKFFSPRKGKSQTQIAVAH